MKENYKRFDVVLVDFGQVEFAGEQGGKRPCIILQNNVGNHFSSQKSYCWDGSTYI